MTSSARARFAGLDGLRAVAVLLVVIYHLFPAWLLRSGFIGVDVFFVISGFLITSLLLREREQTGRIALGSFWIRRARRLMPALAVVVTVCATAAWLIGGDVLVGLGLQVAGAATFSYNWLSIATGASYFTAAQPEVFRNLWSLALEEQFYLLWPLLLPLFLLLPGRWPRTLAALAVGAGSAAWAVALLATAEPTRTYFGTDSHAFGLLLGVALAFALQGAEARTAPPRALRIVGAVLGAAALAGLVALASMTPTTDARTFPGILVVASVLAGVIVAVSVRPGSVFGRALDIAPLRWIGERSYGIYLWHWPLVVLVTAAGTGTTADAGVPVAAGATAAALTLGLAALSYRFVEQPVRAHGFRGVARRMGARFSSSPARRLGAVAAIAAGAVLLGGTTAAVAAAPETTSGEAVVRAGQDALDQAEAADGAAPPAPVSTPADDRPAPPASARVPGDRVTAVGDSVMLASAPGLLDIFPGIHVDAKVSRSMWTAPEILARLAERGQLRDYVVVGLGTNGPVDDDTLTEVDRIVGPDRHLVLVNAYAPRDWIPGVNRELAAFAASHHGVSIADWSSAIDDRTDLLAGDRIHPGASGAKVFADAVATAVQRVEDEQLQARYEAADLLWSIGHAIPSR
ncbi:acyltransferase family protein [uncultured Microbacterium sp.]|uniref:Acyltransferase 3 n=1 Tax=uncultured Microbacterium sp. TaxID=191216 RepID=A0A1Y5P4B4_9MICO|nr:acyltransferase family protein [uncultured Microbacterium sp.]SBS73487.1 Acyltransferase 3 [uncultured Microbacterium sp.]